MNVRLRPWWDTLIELLYPSHCFGCGLAVDEGLRLCVACAAAVPWIGPRRCVTCSRPYPGSTETVPACPNCEGQAFAFECAVAAVRSAGLARELVHRFKYGRQFHLRQVLGAWLIAGFADERLGDEPFDALVPVPLHPLRRRERGYNQAQALAEILGATAQLPVYDCLRRTRHTDTQTRFDRAERTRNLREAFAPRKGTTFAGKRLLVIDDVLTTGSTLHECAVALRQGGARSVLALTVARG